MKFSKEVVKRITKPFNNKIKPQTNYSLENAGKMEWNDRYFNMKKQIAYWQLAFFIVIAIMALFAIILGKMALSAKIEPYLVETNQGVPYAVSALPKLNVNDQRIANFAINQFILNTRTVTSEYDAEKRLLDKVYAFSSTHITPYLNEYYKKHNPFEIAKVHTISIHLINSMPLSDNTWQVIWDEEKRETGSNILVGRERWMGNISYQWGAISSKFVQDNPFGLYVTKISWSKNTV